MGLKKEDYDFEVSHPPVGQDLHRISVVAKEKGPHRLQAQKLDSLRRHHNSIFVGCRGRILLES